MVFLRWRYGEEKRNYMAACIKMIDGKGDWKEANSWGSIIIITLQKMN